MKKLNLEFNGLTPLNPQEISEIDGGNLIYDFFYAVGYAAHVTVALIQDIKANPLPPGDKTPYPVR